LTTHVLHPPRLVPCQLHQTFIPCTLALHISSMDCPWAMASSRLTWTMVPCFLTHPSLLLFHGCEPSLLDIHPLLPTTMSAPPPTHHKPRDNITHMTCFTNNATPLWLAINITKHIIIMSTTRKSFKLSSQSPIIIMRSRLLST
jgi:hypothetical protein